MRIKLFSTLLLILSALSFRAQTTETFETETVNSTSFTDNSQVFNITSQAQGPFDIYSLAGTGWNGTSADARYIDNSGFSAAGFPVQFTISSSGSTAFRLNSMYLFLSTSALNLSVTGSLTITGKLGGVTQFTASSSSGFNTNAGVTNGFTYINMATFGGSNNTAVNIDQFVIITTGNIEYVALDAMTWTTAPTPTITTSGTLTAFTSCSGSVSSSKTFSVSGANLSANLVVTAPTGFEVSTSAGSGYGSSVSLSPGSGTVSSTTIYVRLTSSASGTPSGNVACTSTGATTQNVAASGTVTTITATTTSANVNCYGGTNGSAGVTASGGTPSYTYSWSPSGGTSATATGLAATNYTCTITDANSCTTTKTFTISQPSAALSISSASQTNVSAYGASTGAAAVNAATGGTSSYTYDWTPGTPTGDGTVSVSGLAAGNYTCTVTDANSCTATQTFTITQTAAALNMDGSNDYVSIPNTVSGDFTIEYWMKTTQTGSSGSQWYNATGVVDAEVGGVTNDFGTCLNGSKICFGIGNPDITITSTSSVNTGSWVHIAATWKQSTGAMKLYVNGTLEVSGTSTGTAARTAPSVMRIGSLQTAGNYYNGSIDELRIWSRVLCQGEIQNNMNCEIATTGTNLAANYHFNQGTAGASNAGLTSLTDVSGNSKTGTLNNFGLTGSTSNWFGAGAITSGTSCSAYSPTSVTVTSASQTNVNCYSGTSGAASVSASGGSGFTYDWTPGTPTGDGTASVTGLTAGSWTCTVTNNCGGTGSYTFTITQPASALALTTASQTNVSAYGASTGAASVNAATGGTSSYTYDWTPGTPTGDGTTAITALAAGTYTCTVTDANSCTATQTFTITQTAAALNLDGTNDYVSIPNNSTLNISGAITVEAWVYPTKNSGIQNVISKSSNTSNNGYIFPRTDDGWNKFVAYFHIGGGWKTLDATFGSGSLNQWHHLAATWDGTNIRIYKDGVLVNTSVAYSGSITTNTNVLAIGNQTGFSEYYGGSVDEARVWNRALCQSEIQNNMNCEIATTASGLVANYHFNQGIASGSNSGTTSLTDASGNSNNGTLTNLALSGSTSNWMGAGGVTSGTSCSAYSASAVTVTSASQTNVNCYNGTTGAASVSASGGSGFTYDWTPGTPTGDGTASVTGLTAGSWTCTVTNNCGGTGSYTFTITQPSAALATSAASQTNVLCYNGTTGAAAITTPTGGTTAYTYNWTPGNPTGDGTISVTGLTAGTWTCTVTDANSCTTTQTFTISQPSAALTTSSASQTNILCYNGSTGAAAITTPTGGTAAYSYNWTPGNPTGDGTTSVTGLTVGTWTCTVTDANSCTTTQTFTITQPTAALATSAASQTNVLCYNGTTGAAAITTPTGGTTAYSYNWTPGNPTGDGTTSVTGLTAGTWTCTVTDANSCTTTQTFTLSQPSAALATSAASQTNVLCYNGSTGAAAITTPTGGTTAYSYNWTPGNPTGDGTTSVTGLTAGTWTCTVTDANSCTTAQTFTITEATAITATSSSTTSSCSSPTGSATVNASGGAGSYTYSWAPSGGTAATASNIAAGSYTCTITDASSCSITKTVVVANTAGPVASLSSQTNVSCNTGSNGSATISATGTGTLIYAWAPSGGTAATASGLAFGTYTCTVTDVNSCTTTQTVSITQPTVINTTISSQTNVACNGASTGAATITATGGTTAYTYVWTSNSSTTASATGLAAGNYTCTVTDANNCVKIQAVTITEPSVINTTVSSQTNVGCNGTSTGAATITATGGTGAYTYSWTSNSSTTATATGLAAGTYTCTVSDVNNCVKIQAVTITEPTVINTTVSSQTNLNCNGASTGAATITATGGTGAYTYSWTSNSSTTATATGLAAGTYTCTVTDVNSCVKIQAVTITAPTVINTSVSSQTNVGCNGTSTGAATIAATGGTGAYTYSWTSNSSTSATATGLAAGTYTCTVTDANNCVKIQAVTITEPAVINTTVSSQTNVGCNGASTGAATVTATGGTTAYTYAWTSNSSTTATATGLAAGTYTCTVTDANNCVKIQAVTITEPAVINTTVSSQTNVGCNGASSGAATITATGGTGAYTYSWTSNSSTSATATGLAAGTYTCTVTDANNCVKIQAVTITEPAVINTTVASQTNVSCNGGSTGAATVTATGGTGAYTYSWTSNSTTTATATGLAAGTYTCTVTDANSCVKIQAVTITEPTAITATTSTTTTSCTANTGTATVLATGGTPSYTYAWTPTGGTAANAVNLGVGIYTVSISDANNCSITKTVNITTASGPAATISSSGNVLCNGAATGTATVSATGGAGTLAYTWAPLGGTTATASNLPAGTYTCTVSDVNSCIAIASVTITQSPAITKTQSFTKCAGQSVTIGTHTYTSSGTYIDVLTAVNGCDSTVTTHLTVLPANAFTQNSTKCVGQSLTVGTHTYTTSGTYTDVLTAANGCDSTVTTHLTILNAITGTQTLSLCAGQSLTVGTHTYTSSGTFTDVLTAVSGCDSTVTTHLTVLAPITGTQTLTICYGDTVKVGTGIHTTTGTFTDVLHAANGCDSTVSTNLTVRAPITGSQTLTICAGDTVIVGTGIHTGSGTYTDAVPAANGCDSVITTHLTVLPAITKSQSFTICAGDTITVGTHHYSTSGNYSDVFPAHNGCDSTVTTQLTVLPANIHTQSITVCHGDSITVGTHVYHNSGTYTDLFTAHNGCDSTVTTQLTVLGIISSTQNSTVCSGGSVTVGTHTYTLSGTYTDHLVSAMGCDSVVTTHLTVRPPVNVLVSVSGPNLSSLVSGVTIVSYQWINCSNNAHLATTANYTATANGQYAVIVTTNNGCIDTSICATVNTVGIGEIAADNSDLQIYPNPNTGIFTIKANSEGVYSIRNELGQSMATYKLNAANNYTMNIENLANGMYFIQEVQRSKVRVHKVIVNK